MKPRRNIVLIKPDKAEEKTASGLYLTEQIATPPERGVIVALGPDCIKDLAEGMHVVYLRYEAQGVEKELQAVHDDQVIAVIED